MHYDSIVFNFFLIFTGAAVVATFVLFTRQSLLVAYMLLGALFGPWGLKLVADSSVVKQIGEVGITFLLFLIGLHLQPQNLIHMLRKVTVIAVISSVAFAAVGYFVSIAFGFSHTDALIVGGAGMFSSTIIGLKLLPTTILHHKHTGEVMISVLLMQDLIAIVVLMILQGASDGFSMYDFVKVSVAFPALIGFAFLLERYVLVKLLAKFDQVHEYIFLLSIGWCLGFSQFAHLLGLSEEIGAFIAGVVLAASPISLFIAESLKPLRDFFLVMFFFSIGAGFNFGYLHIVLMPALVLGTILLIFKPLCYYLLFKQSGEMPSVSAEVGIRLGQASEFSLLVGALAVGSGLLTETGEYFIQAMTIMTFIVSSYWVVLKYPTPLALTDDMRQD